VGAAPTNKLHGLSPSDLNSEYALERAYKRDFSDEREVLMKSTAAIVKGKKKILQLRASVKIIFHHRVVIHTYLCITCS
jgi:hypothetical protein